MGVDATAAGQLRPREGKLAPFVTGGAGPTDDPSVSASLDAGGRVLAVGTVSTGFRSAALAEAALFEGAVKGMERRGRPGAPPAREAVSVFTA